MGINGAFNAFTRCDFIGASLILGYLPNLGAGRGKLPSPRTCLALFLFLIIITWAGTPLLAVPRVHSTLL